MKWNNHWIVRFVSLLMFACTSCVGSGTGGAPCDLSTSAALRDAAADVRSHHAKIYLAGTIASDEVGIDETNRAFVASLPRSNVLSRDCMDPEARNAIEYARTYNRAVASSYGAKE